MRIEFDLVACEIYDQETFLNSNKLFKKYITDWKDAFLPLTGFVFEDLEVIHQVLSFVFNETYSANELFNSNDLTILDLSLFKSNIIDQKMLDGSYESWIEKTGRANTMDEYAMLLEIITLVSRNMTSNKLIARITIINR